MWLFAIFVAVPIIEIALLLQVGGWLGLWPTLALVVLTAALGTTLVRRQGSLEVRRLQESLQQMSDPTQSIAHGAMILASGLLLLTPGFFTDGVGFALLVPAVRNLVLRQIVSKLSGHIEVGGVRQSASGVEQPDVVDGEFVDISADREPSGWTGHGKS